MLLNPAALDPSIASYQDPQFGLNSPLLNPAIGRTPLYASLFNRFGPSIDPSSPYQPKDADKKRLFRQGLLAFAAASAKPNGGNFADSLASGLLAANGAMQDGTQQYANDAYRTDVMNRTRDEMAANTAKQAAYSHLWGDDNQLSPQGEAEVRKADPMGYLSIYDKLHPQETAWQPKEVTFNGNAGTVLWNAKTGEMKTLDGQPFNAGGAQVAAAPQATPQAAPGGSALDAAVQQVESGGNPFAVSPKGALGPMQTMPGTLTDPGFGVTPARDNSPEEQRRVGIEYLHALMSKFGTQGGLAAYNWGPGHWQAALGQYGTPDAALAHAPPETRAYVPKVLARAGGVTSAIPSQTASGTIPASLPFGFAPKKPDKLSTVDQRKQDVAEMEASGIKVTPTMRNQYIMTGKMPGEDGEAVLPQGTENLTGDDFLKALPPQDANMVRSLVEGRKAWPTASAMKDPDWKRWTAEAQQYDSAADENTFKTRATTRKGFITGTQGQQINALNTTASHLLEAAKAIDNLHNSGLPAYNAVANFVSKASGKDPVTNFQAVITPIASEMEKVYRGSGGTEAGVQAWKDALSPNASPEQQRGVLKEWVNLVKGKIDAQQQQYDQGMGPLGTPLRMVNPNAQKAYDTLSGIVTKLGEDPASFGLPPARSSTKAPAQDGWSITQVGH
jgi:hypothetical protein